MIEISNAEFEVLNIIWKNNPVSAEDIVLSLNKEKQWHEKTVKTLLNRLVKKQALDFEKSSRKYLYYPLIAREDYTRKESQSFIQRVFAGRVSPLVAGFVKDNSLQKEDIDELKQLIEQWEHNND